MEGSMLAAVFEGVGRFLVEEIPVPQIQRDDDVLLKVEACSVCGTDVHMTAVPPGFLASPHTVLGHEYVGRVVGKGSRVGELEEGDRVVVEPNIPCLECSYCRMGLPNQCENVVTLGIHIHGGFAPFNVAPARTLHRISPSVPAPVATIAEPLSCALGGTEKVKVQPGDNVVILGAGPIGLLFLQLVKASGAAKVIVSEPSVSRRTHALEIGADIVVDPCAEDLRGVVQRETGIGADIVIEVVGSALGDGLDVVRRRGKVLLFGLNEETSLALKPYTMTRYELEVMGTYIGNNTFPRAIKLLENHAIAAQQIITHVLPLTHINEAMELMRSGRGIKIVIDPWLHD